MFTFDEFSLTLHFRVKSNIMNKKQNFQFESETGSIDQSIFIL